MREGFSFDLLVTRGAARRGRLTTPHGSIETPEFLPVGTQATVKAILPRDIREVGVQGVLANTYHLYLRPGSQRIQALGGLHRFMSWDGPIMTDSGGFQAFSLGAGREHGVSKIGGVFPDEAPPKKARQPRDPHPRRPGEPKSQSKPQSGHASSKLVKIDEEGVLFRSHLDGSSHKLTPELSIRIQEELGADLILAFDECTSPLADKNYTEYSLERTHRWAVRCLQARRDTPQALYGIIQGGAYRDLRDRSTAFLTRPELGFDGYAVGGSLGRNKEEMLQVLDWTVFQLPAAYPRHLLGIGEIGDLFDGVQRGIDTFDCVIPTRFARNGHLLCPPGLPGRGSKCTLSMRNACYADDSTPPIPGCECYCCANFSRAYLRHLYKCSEILACQLGTIHNLHFMARLMREIRQALEDDRLAELRAHWV